MFDALAGIGLLGFLIFIVLGLVALVKKSGKAKKRFGIAAGLFVLFMVGVLNSPTSETATTDGKSDEGEVKAAKEEDADQKEEKQPEKEPATLEEVKAAVTAGMSDKDFKKAKKDLNVEQLKNISIGNGNVGYVLQATDGIILATTDGESIMEVLPFASMDEVGKYESEMVAKAEAEAKATSISRAAITNSTSRTVVLLTSSSC
jgi:mannitol-specific phosphotransferase system IIBC component